MAVTFRSVKGAALTHAEIDQNFREFIYSGSVSGSDLILYRSQSSEPEIIVPLVKSSGPIGAVNLTAEGNTFTGSHDFKYDQQQKNLMLTGSFFQDGDHYVNGTVYARQFTTTLVSASIIYRSGSTKFGDTADDTHQFLGYVDVVGNIVASRDITADQRVVSPQITGSLSGSVAGIGDVVAFSSSVDARLDAAEQFSSSLDATFATDLELSNVSSSILNTLDDVSASLQDSIDTKVPYGFNVALTGDITGTGTLSAPGLSITTTIADDSHNHIISNIDGLQTALDAKATIAQLNASSSALISALTTAYQNADTTLSQSAEAAYVKKSGDIISGDLTITGDLEIQGTQTSINTTNLVVSDKLISIASGSTTATAANGAGVHVSGANALFTYDAANNRWGANIPISASSFVGGVVGSIEFATSASQAENSNKLNGQSPSYYLNYNNFSNTPTIPTVPTNVSAFTNDAGYTTFDGAYSSLTGTPTIPTNNNQLTNGAGYTTYTSDQGTSTSSNPRFNSLGIGTTAPGSGGIRATGDIIAYYSSDKRLKDNITPLSNAIDKINQIGGYEFDWNDNSEHSGHDVGVIAQEIEKVLPEVVTTRDNGYMAVRYEKIVALLIEAVKEQQLQIEELKSKL